MRMRRRKKGEPKLSVQSRRALDRLSGKTVSYAPPPWPAANNPEPEASPHYPVGAVSRIRVAGKIIELHVHSKHSFYRHDTLTEHESDWAKYNEEMRHLIESERKRQRSKPYMMAFYWSELDDKDDVRWGCTSRVTMCTKNSDSFRPNCPIIRGHIESVLTAFPALKGCKHLVVDVFPVNDVDFKSFRVQKNLR